jgi:hypothetical protein
MRSPGPPVETPPPMRRCKNRPVRLSRCVGAGFERVASVFERGGREPMEGSLGSAGEEQAPRRSGCRKSGVLDEPLERPQSSGPTGPHTSGDGPDELAVPRSARPNLRIPAEPHQQKCRPVRQFCGTGPISFLLSLLLLFSLSIEGYGYPRGDRLLQGPLIAKKKRHRFSPVPLPSIALPHILSW